LQYQHGKNLGSAKFFPTAYAAKKENCEGGGHCIRFFENWEQFDMASVVKK
jgi:hypothetical protein